MPGKTISGKYFLGTFPPPWNLGGPPLPPPSKHEHQISRHVEKIQIFMLRWGAFPQIVDKIDGGFAIELKDVDMRVSLNLYDSPV